MKYNFERQTIKSVITKNIYIIYLFVHVLLSGCESIQNMLYNIDMFLNSDFINSIYCEMSESDLKNLALYHDVFSKYECEDLFCYPYTENTLNNRCCYGSGKFSFFSFNFNKEKLISYRISHGVGLTDVVFDDEILLCK